MAEGTGGRQQALNCVVTVASGMAILKSRSSPLGLTRPDLSEDPPQDVETRT